MKKYIKPEFELIETVLDDVIAASIVINETNHDLSKGADEVW